MKWIKTYERWIYVGVAVVVAFFFLFQQEQQEEELLPAALEPPTSIEPIDERIVVDVKGAVKRQGVYEVEPTSRVYDVIQQAGGFTDDADETKVNLAMKVKDEMVIYVPTVGETSSSSSLAPSSSSYEQADGAVNINTATVEQLQTLAGIGPAKAAAIVSHREQNGPFQRVEDLLNVSGIGAKTFEKIKERIVVR